METIGPPTRSIDPSHRAHVIATLKRMADKEAAPTFRIAETINNPEAVGIFVKCRNVINRCESPIEQRLIFALDFDLFLMVQQQIPLSGYRGDFGFPTRKIVVECDGHEFHKTQDQRSHDAKRDRVFIEAGWTVVRFTGSEIFRDAEKCAREISRIVDAAKKPEPAAEKLKRSTAVPSARGESTGPSAD